MSDQIIERYQAFWQQYASETDFLAMSKVLRGLLTYCKSQYGDISDQIELITDYATELERYLPLMNLDEFVSASKSVTYAKRTIKNSGTIDYGAGLSRDVSAEDLLRESSVEGSGSLDAGNGDTDNGSGNLIDDLRLESDDD